MLVHLSIHNYAIVEHLDLELQRGMTSELSDMRRMIEQQLAGLADVGLQQREARQRPARAHHWSPAATRMALIRT